MSGLGRSGGRTSKIESALDGSIETGASAVGPQQGQDMKPEHETTRRDSTRRVNRRKTLAGFTLIELLVVVAMLSLITLGLARIFRSAGDTARAGRRVSNTNTYATLIERQLRSDIASMTRSGFLVIRNQTAGSAAPSYSGAAIALAPGAPNPRPRRVDELVFFAKGDFTSQRSPIHPDRSPRSAEAMIYYGHGLKWNPSHADYLADLELDDPNGNATTPGFGAAGPDRFASDWVLARRAFVMQPPNLTPTTRLPNGLAEPSPVWPGPPQNPSAPNSNWEDLDRNVQISLQPAAISAFRVIASDGRNQLPTNANLVRDESPVQRPLLSSGLVDVIASSLTEVRDIVLDAQQVAGVEVPFDLNDDVAMDGRGGVVFQTDLQPSAANSTTRRMHDWMRQAFPADSDAGRRVRLELRPPNWTGALDSTNGTVFDKEYKRTDQEMLTSFNFVPYCTEFIVEWSFGTVYPANYSNTALRGQVIWHGKARVEDLNGDGNPAPGAPVPNPSNPAVNVEVVARPYQTQALGTLDTYQMPFRRLDGSNGFHTVSRDVVMPQVLPLGGGEPAVYSYFGYVDPTYQPRGLAFDDVNGDGVRQPAGTPPLNIPEQEYGDGDTVYEPWLMAPPGALPERRNPVDPETIPWAWPKLIRITMSIVDPQDPRSEQTFQFTFEVPDGTDPAAQN